MESLAWLVRELLLPDLWKLLTVLRRGWLALAGANEQLDWGPIARWRLNLIGLRWFLCGQKCSSRDAYKSRFDYAERRYLAYQFDYAERRYLAHLACLRVEPQLAWAA